MTTKTVRARNQNGFRAFISPSLQIFPLLAVLLTGCRPPEGKVLNGADNKPIPNAVIFHNGKTYHPEPNGHFKLTQVDYKKPLMVKALGYRQMTIPLKKYSQPDARLQPFAAKALYLSHAAIGAEYLRAPVMKLIEDTDLNAVVVDVKGQRGLASFSWEIPLGHQIGAFSKITIDDPDAFIKELHKKNIYVIGRISVFKDESMAAHKKEWALIDTKTDRAFRDGGDKMPWMDPFQEAVWDYNLAYAKAAAEVGFDEILFDYVRFPLVSSSRVKYLKESTKESRTDAVTKFFKKAAEELAPYNVYISAGISGNAMWAKGDADIGQELEAIAPLVDYLNPIVYPSDIPWKTVGLQSNAVRIPQEAVTQVLKLGLDRIGNQSVKMRPWLQQFKDYALDRREFREEEVAKQLIAARDAHTSGWVLYNPENKYPYTAKALELLEKGLPSEKEMAQDPE